MPDVLGLPAHPLIVHAVVVLVPLAAGSFLLLSWRRDWWRRYGAAVVLLACLGALAAMLAVESGEALQSPVRRAAAEAGISARFGDHPTFGAAARIAAVAFAASLGFFWLADARRDVSPFFRRAAPGAQALAGLAALFAIGSVVLAGHSGSRLVWRDLGSFAVARSSQGADPQAAQASGAAAAVVPEGAIVVEMRGFRYEPETVSVPAGEDVTIAAVNRGRINHTFTVEALRLDSGVLRPGETKVITFAAPASPRTYVIVCTEEGHDEEGMIGRLIIE
jgi:plastocyanin